MNALEMLERGGVRVYAEGDAVRLRGPREVLTPEVIVGVRARKDELAELLFEREERAALMGAPEDSAGDAWGNAATHPGVLVLLEKFARCGLQIVSVTPTRRRESEAA